MRFRSLLIAAVAMFSLAVVPTALAGAPTIVSLTFDDALASQSVLPAMLASHGMHGTFYVNSAHVGTPGFMTWGQVADVYAAGNEIAGHTLDHVDLMNNPTTATYQVCDDRARLLKHGFPATDFAYPYGSGWRDSTTRSIIQSCGYNSARGAWGLISPTCQPPNCWDYAEPIPPNDIWAIRTADNPELNTTLATIESYVTNAENHGGGWVILVFHEICDGCDQYSTSQSELGQFLDWLQPRASQGTVVKPVAEVIGGALQPSPGTQDTTAPSSAIACNGAPCGSANYTGAVSVALNATDAGGSGLDAVRYTTDGSSPTLQSPVYSGPFTVSTTTTVNYAAWDNAGNVEQTNSQTINFAGPDLTPPASSISCNGATCSGGWYAAPVSVSLSATDADSGVATIRYTTDGTDPTASSASYNGSLTINSTATIKYRAWDNAGNVESTNSQTVRIDTTAPASSISCNGATCSAGWYGATVQVALAATDSGSGLATIRYTTDGSNPTASSTPYSIPFNVSATTTVKYAAVDNAGNVEATNSQTVRIDTTAPASSITCNAGTCSTGWYRASVQVALGATDSGSGVAAIRYTTDGSTPTATSPLYTTPFTISTTTTIKFRSWDNAGNAEATKTQTIQVDTTGPSVSITFPTNGSRVSGNVQVQATASDSGSGIAQVALYVDGQLQGTSSAAPYKFPWNTKKFSAGTHTLTTVATDRAGNTTTSAAVTVTVGGTAAATSSRTIQSDRTRPTVSITYPTNGFRATGNIRVRAVASDRGSGIARVALYVDGRRQATSAVAPYKTPWNTRKFSRGKHTLRMMAIDRAGNTTISAAVTVTVT